ncbi:helix-turn-helix transcriptional regulator [Chlorogloeopsis fritschii PCC 9212]|nr:helix-turn-helix transcriptional regulator [Chlorogloeopsis fritschii]
MHQANFRLKDRVESLDVLEEMVEILDDGILIIGVNGDLVYANASANTFCYQINPEYFEYNFVPPTIWKICQKLINNQSIHIDNFIIFDEILLDNFKAFRVCIRLLKLERLAKKYFLVIIENQYKCLENQICMEIEQYNFTPRETEIWQLYRAKYTYKEIASQLHITINTVKKHMKNIHAKRRQ